MKLDDFDFDLPPSLIAQHPIRPRDEARMLVVGERFEDQYVRDLPDLLRPSDILVCNDTRVIPARLGGRRGAARVELTLHRAEGPDRWRAFARPARRLAVGDRIDFAPGFAADVAEKGTAGEVVVRFALSGEALMAAIEAHGAMPLPPYIKRPEGPEDEDRDDYQTMFAAVPGAVAAPTAGLHFSPALVAALDARGIAHTTVTLHVGAGTFLPIRTAELGDHSMHAEKGVVEAAAVESIERARAAGGRVVAVGTTVLRLLESATGPAGRLAPFHGETDLFVMPGYRFRAVDLLMTNFHLPRSTLFVLVAAFAGRERMLAAYEHAKDRGYRFYSFGDSSLLIREGTQ